jgi:hypothetical protein
VDAARGFEATVSQLENAIEAIEDLVIVSYCDDRGILIDGNLAEQVHDDPGSMRVERRGRLVGKDDARPVGQCSRNRHALGFAAGKFRWHRFLAMSDLEIVEKLDGTGACCCRGKSGQIEYDGNVVGSC